MKTAKIQLHRIAAPIIVATAIAWAAALGPQSAQPAGAEPDTHPAAVKQPGGNAQGVQSDYMLRDNIRNIVVVDENGSGDYASLDTAYAHIGPLSSYDNQYLIKVLPGTYAAANLTPPAYSNTLGEGPLGSVVFKDTAGSVRMFDQKYPSKFTNVVMDITNSKSYVIHFDAPTLAHGVTVNTNCRLIHRGGGGGAAVIGGGSWPGYISIWKSCEFIGFAGNPTCHTKENTDNSIDLRYINCSFSGGANFGSLGSWAPSHVTFEGCNIRGNLPGFFISPLTNVNNLAYYPANNINWSIEGSGNKGLVFKFSDIANGGQALQEQATNYSQDVTISGTAAHLLFGNGKTKYSNSRIYGSVTGCVDVRDVQMGKAPYSTPTDIIQMWKRLGDCSVNHKTLTVTVGGASQTYTFTADYLIGKTSEATIIADINAVITNAVMTKVSGINMWDIMNTSDKMGVEVGDANGLLANELVVANGYRANKVAKATDPKGITGIVLIDAKQGQETEIWTGALYVTLADGEYGVGSNSQLSASESVKVGYVKSNVFYPYYGRF